MSDWESSGSNEQSIIPDRDAAEEELRPPKCPAEECELTTDIIIESSDGVKFGAHQHTLGVFSQGFPLPGTTSISLEDPVVLSEDSTTIRLLLQMMHSTPVPDAELHGLSFTDLEKLADAAEKYAVGLLIAVCRIKMEALNFIDEHPLRVFRFATKHGILRLRAAAGPKTLKMPLESVVDSLKDVPGYEAVLIAWMRMRETFYKRRDSAKFVMRYPPAVMHKGGIQRCDDWEPFRVAFVGELETKAEQPASLLSFREHFQDTMWVYKHLLHGCSYCLKCLDQWKSQWEARYTGEEQSYTLDNFMVI